LVLDSFGLLLGLGFLSEELLLDVFFELDPLALQRKSKLACVLNFRGFGAVILVISGAVALSRLAFLEIIRNIGCLLISVILLVFIILAVRSTPLGVATLLLKFVSRCWCFYSNVIT
jgi:hypothetical protein